jgi:hypothetical protein
MISNLFICKDRSSGDYKEGKYGLWNSARFVVEYLNSIGRSSVLLSVTDGNCIDKEIHKYKPNRVILEALWVTPEKIKELKRLHKDVVFIIRIHSKAPFLSNEGIAFDWCNKLIGLDNVMLTANNIDFVSHMNLCGYPIHYLPNIYSNQLHNFRRNKIVSNDIHIGCFGSIRLMKNQLIQAMSAIAFGDCNDYTVHFHMNGTRSEQNGGNVLKNIIALFDNQPSHQLHLHPWQSHNDFVEKIKMMHLGMQVSYTESFNIVTADFIRCNIPIVTSKEISINTSLLHADPNSVKSIVKSLEFANNFGAITNRLSNFKLNRHNLIARTTWSNFVDTYWRFPF